MTNITFNAVKREKAGKGAARACRREGRIPAVIYGGNKEPELISLNPIELLTLKLSLTAKNTK